MQHEKLAQSILKNLGGSSNVESATHCVTRLRLSIKDKTKVNDEAIKNMENVSGTTNSGGQYQIIIGPAVEEVYKEFEKIYEGNSGTSSSKKTEEGNQKKKNIFSRVVDVLISCFAPVIPVIAGSGMIKVLITILLTTGVFKEDSPTISILAILGDGVFYFLPFFIAFTAAKKFNVDHFTAMVMAAILLHPNLVALSAEGATFTSFLEIPLYLFNYSAQAIPVILAIWLMSYVDPIANRMSPPVFKVFLRPMITILIVAPVMLILFGPLGAILGDYFGQFVEVMNTWGWIAVSINALIFPFLVITGTHNAMIPLIITMFATNGYDPILLVSGLLVNIAQAGAAFSVAMRTKSLAMRGTGISAGVSALFGITEPALYGVNLRLKRPFIAVLIGSALAGVVAGLAGVTAYSFVSPSVLTLPIFIGPEGFISLVWAIVAMLCAFILTFILVWIMGFKDPIDDNNSEKSEDTNDHVHESDIKVFSPLKGEAVSLEKVNDETFASGAMGKGVAIMPSEGKVVAPFEGTVQVVSNTKHAVGLVSESGMELLIHVGIDTVELKGEHFQTRVEVGNHVKKGDVLLDFNLKEIQQLGYDTTTSIVILNSDKYSDLTIENGEIDFGEAIIK
ncbi:beta-glucoside-specific PTS transporter subunit IIABC [Alkalicoccobacillus murimartini]|uniref:PTS system beta-glucosides-specific IIC component n=1 Tax=Alkalicoccobacillus murimartini TaxID=171685 RepID=A0ABT9YM93_9BACI|nr:beta-glucoside-specific PTS transporter subunit IIABC [Alkalicoccobacillus murimartini]MDQ0208605.1 PTS system beta-glucosides-specific IIC component [Alkalicoccobacillus murimartini]